LIILFTDKTFNMKKILVLSIHLLWVSVVFAQEKSTSGKVHQIVFQLSSGDTLAHKALMKQLQNIMTVAPQTKVDVICHGPGLSMLVSQASIVSEKITNLQQQHAIRFYACEFSMKERKVSKENIIPGVGSVPAGIIAIVSRQEEGWSYIKAGF